MHRIIRSAATTFALGLIPLLAGCEGGGGTPTAESPPIPTLDGRGTGLQSFVIGGPDLPADCAEWHCESGICGNDTAIYGACCTQAVDEEHPYPEPRPSCQSTQSYCYQYPQRCVESPECNAMLAPPHCYHAQPPEGYTWYDFPECLCG